MPFKPFFTLGIIWLAWCTLASGQKVIILENPGFEGTPGAGTEIQGWDNQGDHTLTPPDLQPGFFRVKTPPKQGRTYLGMSIRENNTWESVGQWLKSPLLKESEYLFSVWLCRPDSMLSAIIGSVTPKQFSAPAVLQIWGRNPENQSEELLAESEPVDHTNWMRYDFVLKPLKDNYYDFVLMAYFKEASIPENGYLMVDGCSNISKLK